MSYITKLFDESYKYMLIKLQTKGYNNRMEHNYGLKAAKSQQK